MERVLNEAVLNNDPCAKALVGLLSDNEGALQITDSILYHNFPLYRNDDGTSTIARVMVVSNNHGILIFQCVDQTERTLTESDAVVICEDLEQIHSIIYSELVKSRLLRTKITKININIVPSIFAPNYHGNLSVFHNVWPDLDVVQDYSNLKILFENTLLESPLDENIIKEALSVLEGSKGIIRPKDRPKDERPSTKGRILEEIEAQIANFDTEQKRAALMTIDGPQRIRGLAGSGKTIVLTMKAALIHLQHPEAEVFYTFYTRSLYSLVLHFVTMFYRRFSGGKEPNWDKLRILHAWGGENLPGVYYITCLNNNVTPIPFNEVRHEKDPFNEVCKRLNQHELVESFDYSIIDEGQDFPPEFYRLCRRITKNNRVIWGYDECQNIFDISIQDTKETFGKDSSGNYYIDFSELPPDSLQDMVLHVCYRNPRRVLTTAFAIGLGIYNERILQMPENNEHWEDLGFKVLEGSSKINDSMVITRPLENSPLLLNSLLESVDVVKVKAFESYEEECQDVVDMIAQDIEDNLLPEDIFVISLDDRYARRYFKIISALLNKRKIKSFNILDAPFYSKEFYMKQHVTLTTVYRAKGNEAGSVYVVGVDAIYQNKDSIRERNRLFTAITRAKGWVTITGEGSNAQTFIREMELVNQNYPDFKFKMPDPNSLKVFQRDLSIGQAQLNKIEKQLDAIARKTGLSKEQLLKNMLEKELKEE